MASDQIEIRNRILDVCFDFIDKDINNTVQAFVACMGAAATVAAVLPPAAREELISAAEGSLLMHANKRADEMRDGSLDRELTGH